MSASLALSSTAARAAVIESYLRLLRLPAINREYEAVAREARDQGWDYEEYLKQLVEAEVRSRQDKGVGLRLKQARFPDLKTLDQLDWSAMEGLSRPKISELSTCEYIKCGEAVIFAGPIGTGKTHLAIALGVEAARRRLKVAFARAADLVRDLLEARDDRVLARLHQRMMRVDLLIIDELGFVPFDRAGGELLFNLLSDRYERRSTMITTNLAFSEWVQVFGNEKLTTALLDRLSHHSHIITTKGSSFRTSKKTRRAGSSEENARP